LSNDIRPVARNNSKTSIVADASVTEREVRALIERVRATHIARRPEAAADLPPTARLRPADVPPPPPPPPPVVPSGTDGSDADELEAKERRLQEHTLALERQMTALKRQKAALQLQRRERELRDAAARAVDGEVESGR
jgi:hypothetical protein